LRQLLCCQPSPRFGKTQRKPKHGHALKAVPQAFRSAIPALTGHTIGMLKDTSLVTVVSLQDLTGAMSMSLSGDADWHPFFLEAYLLIAAVYALLCLGVSAIGHRLEQRYPALGQAQ
jgi:general L-amino acid transport system permease protein